MSLTKTEGAIGYADVAYALKNKIRFASMLNKSGKYATPGLRGIAAAAATAPKMITGDGAISIVDPPEGQPARLPDLDLHLRDRFLELVEEGGAAEDDLLGGDAGPDLREAAALLAAAEAGAGVRLQADQEDLEQARNTV